MLTRTGRYGPIRFLHRAGLELIPQRQVQPVAPQWGLCRRQIEPHRVPAAIEPFDPARPGAGLDDAGIRVPPGEIERRPLAPRHPQAGRQSPSQPRPAGARHEGPRLRECHARLTADHAGRAEATADEGAQRAERAHPHAGEIHIHGQDPRQRGQIHGHGLLTVGGQEVGVTIERKSRPVGQKGLQPHGGRHGVPEPKLNAGDRANVPHRPARRAVTAHAAAVQRGRDQARTVRVGEVGVGRTAQVEPGAQVDVLRDGQSGKQGRRGRHHRHGRAWNLVVPPLRCDPRRGVSHCASACARRDVVIDVAGVDALGPQRVAL